MSGKDTPERTPAQKETVKNLAPPWKPGQSGNPAGRPKGARNKLSEDFFKALAEDFETEGMAAIRAMRTERPNEYAKMIASLQTKQEDVKVEGHLSDRAREWLNR